MHTVDAPLARETTQTTDHGAGGDRRAARCAFRTSAFHGRIPSPRPLPSRLLTRKKYEK